MIEYPALLQTIRDLPTAQFNLLGLICINHDEGISQAQAQPLIDADLIVKYEERIGGWPPCSIYRYDVESFAVHMAWCEVCTERHASEVTP